MSYRHVTIFSPPKDKIVLLVTVNKYNPPHRKWNMKKEQQQNKMVPETMEINSHLLETGSAALLMQ